LRGERRAEERKKKEISEGERAQEGAGRVVDTDLFSKECGSRDERAKQKDKGSSSSSAKGKKSSLFFFSLFSLFSIGLFHDTSTPAGTASQFFPKDPRSHHVQHPWEMEEEIASSFDFARPTRHKKGATSGYVCWRATQPASD
jgi:hypothetical protein